LPFGTKVTVTNKSNGRSVVVTINDRGPFVRGRVIDVTPAAARVLGFSRSYAGGPRCRSIVRLRAAEASTLQGLDVDRRAIAPAGQEAVLILAHVGDLNR